MVKFTGFAYLVIKGGYYLKIMVLGSGQDAGIPHTGCSCDTCNMARKKPKQRRLGPSIALLDNVNKYCYLIDASPDFKYQLEMVKEDISEVMGKGKFNISGIFLTHAHYGHITGLLQLGKEVMDAGQVPVFCSREMAQFLNDNLPYRLLVENENIKIREIYAGEDLEFIGFTCIPFSVPHRNEMADCTGFSLYSKKSEKNLVYIPDMDHWTDDVLDRIGTADIAIIDGTFYSKDEISRYEDVPHPPVGEAVELLNGMETEIYFTHINHTNPMNLEGKERRYVEGLGFKVAFDGMSFDM